MAVFGLARCGGSQPVCSVRAEREGPSLRGGYQARKNLHFHSIMLCSFLCALRVCLFLCLSGNNAQPGRAGCEPARRAAAIGMLCAQFLANDSGAN